MKEQINNSIILYWNDEFFLQRRNVESREMKREEKITPISTVIEGKTFIEGYPDTLLLSFWLAAREILRIAIERE